MSKLQSLISPCGAQTSHCGYCCDSDDTSKSYGVLSPHMSVYDYEKLMLRGWRRAGTYFYKPTMHLTCCPQYTIRLKANKFKISKSQKQLIRRFDRYLEKGDIHLITPGIKSNDQTNKTVTTATRNEINTNSIETGAIHKHISSSDHILQSSAAANNDTSTLSKYTFTIETVPPESTHERYELYKKYQMAIHHDPPEKITELRFREFLVESPLFDPSELLTSVSSAALNMSSLLGSTKNKSSGGSSSSSGVTGSETEGPVPSDFTTISSTSSFSVGHNRSGDNVNIAATAISTPPSTVTKKYGSFHQLYRLNNVLIAVGVIDLLPSGLSAVYMFYDPEYRDLVLGKYTALCELRYCLSHEYDYYYMGFYIDTCEKMKYKSDYHPSELLCPVTWEWFDFDTVCKLLLNKYRFTPFRGDKLMIRQQIEERIEQLLLVQQSQLSQQQQQPSALQPSQTSSSSSSSTKATTTTTSLQDVDINQQRKRLIINDSILQEIYEPLLPPSYIRNYTNVSIPAAATAKKLLTSSSSSSSNSSGVDKNKSVGDEEKNESTDSSSQQASFNLNNIKIDLSKSKSSSTPTKLSTARLVTLSQLKPHSQVVVEPILKNWVNTSGSDIAINIIIKF